MDVVSIGFLAAFCLLGGWVAVRADRWGRALGKQRRTILGLRPRKTAELIVFLGGVFIPLLAIVLVMSLSSDVREWLLRGRDAIAQVKQTTKKLDDLQKVYDEQASRAKTDIAALNKSIASLKSSRAALVKQAEEMRLKAASLEANVRAAGAKMAVLLANVRTLTADVGKGKAELAAITKQKAAAIKERDSVSSAYKVLSGDVKAAYDELARLQAEQSRLQASITQLNVTIGTLTGDKKKLAAELDDLQSTFQQLQQKLGETQGALDRASQELAAAESALERVKGWSTYSRTQPLMYLRDEEVARVEVGGNLTPQEAQIEVSRLLRTARSDAQERGARGTANIPPAGLVTRTIGGREVSAEEQQLALVQSMTGLADPIVLVAVSFMNAFTGENVALDIKLYRNPVVFRLGDILADSRIDGSKEPGEILDELTRYFKDQVRSTALKKGMIPIAGREDSLGSVSSSQVLDLVWRIKQTGRAIRVQAVAAAEVRAGDPLKLEYRLK